jgi:hypothetical protein
VHQVMQAATQPPVQYYSFFLTSLLETVRSNICECVIASYRSLSLQAATEVLMFNTTAETMEFISSKHPELSVESGTIDLISHKGDSAKLEEERKSHRLIEQTLTYAAELERIV